MQLKVLIEATGKSWTLKPGREYLMGTSPDCDIVVESIDDSIAFVKFKFDGIGSLWHIENLKKDSTTLLNSQRLTRSIIQAQSQLKVVGQSIVLAPEMANISQQIPQVDRPSNSKKSHSPGSYSQIPNATISRTYAQETHEHEFAKLRGLKNESYPSLNDFMNGMRQRNVPENSLIPRNSASIYLSPSGLTSPTDGAGILLPGFSLALTLKVDRSEASRICKRLYEDVNQKINDGSLGKGRSRIITYSLNNNPRSEELRHYILATYNTHTKARTTIFIRFLESGDNLYLGVDTYILGKTDRSSFYKRIPVSILLLFFAPGTIFLSLIPFFFIWKKLYKRFVYEEDFRIALRQEFPGSIIFNAFDQDNILIFIKTTLHAAIESISEIFEEEKLPLNSLDAFAQQVNSGSTTIVNNHGGGSIDMRGAAVGGAGNNAGYSKTLSK